MRRIAGRVPSLQQNFIAEQLHSVRYVGTDSPSEKLFTQLRNICPNLRALMLDPIHLAIVYEYGFWNKKSSGSKQLRRILHKCIAVDSRLDKNYWQSPYDGKMARPLGDEENKYRDMILDISMSDRRGVHQVCGCIVSHLQVRGDPHSCRAQQSHYQDTLGCMRSR